MNKQIFSVRNSLRLLTAVLGFWSVIVSSGQTCTAPPAGLVSWWRADGNGDDFVGTNSASLQSGVGFGAGKVGQGFSFDGVDDRIVVNNSPSLNFGAGVDFSIEGWIRPITGSTSFGIQSILDTRSFSPLQGISFHLVDGRLSCQLATGGVFNSFESSGPDLRDGNLHHVALTVDRDVSTGGKLYVDGVIVLTFNPTGLNGNLGNADPLRIGNHADLSFNGFFKGIIDELSIYNRALAAADIQAIHASSVAGKCTTPVAPFIISAPTNQTVVVGGTATFSVIAGGTLPLSYQWQFNGSDITGETNSTLTRLNVQTNDAGLYSVIVSNAVNSTNSGTATLTVNSAPPCSGPPLGLISWWRGENNALDQTSGNDGTLSGNTAYGVGRVGEGFVFDGDADVVSVGNPANLRLQDFTIEAWIRRGSTSVVSYGSYNIGCIFAYGQGGYGLLMDSSAQVALSQIGNDTATAGPSITDTNLHHVAVTKSGTTVVVYIDGVAYPAPAYDRVFTFSAVAGIGARADNMDNSFFGTIDEVAVYNRVLSGTEIQSVFNAGGGGKCTTPVAPYIVTQPTNQTVIVGGTATFVVVAGGTQPLSYQWQFNGSDLPDQTNSTYTLSNVHTNNAGLYSVVVSNSVSFTNSSSALLTVNPPPPCTPLPADLISWWPAGGNGIDVIGPNSGTLLNGLSFTNGKVGQAFYFDGTNDRFVVPDTSSLNFGSNADFSIEAWIHPLAGSTSFGIQSILAKQFTGSPTVGVSFHLVSGRLSCQLATASSLASYESSGPDLRDGNFHHVALTVDRDSTNGGRLYVDGVVVLNFNPTAQIGSLANTQPLRVGNHANTSFNGFFKGAIDEISLYGRALSTNEIQAIYNAGGAGKCVIAVPPSIGVQPTNTTVTVGSNATFAVSAGGSPPLTYQWLFNGTNIIADATSSTLTLTNVQFSQAGTYSVIVSNATGHTNSSDALLSVAFPPATIRVMSVTTTSGAPVTVPVLLAANGNENALSFSLSFSTQRLSFASVSLGSGATNASLLPNTNQLANGRLGLALALGTGETFSPGTQEVALVTFDTQVLTGTQSVTTAVSFGDQPITRRLANAQAQALSANYSNGTVTLTPSDLEADVTPRPGGDRNLDILDWVQVGRFVAALDTPATGAEFQRADCAPRSTLGDGQFKVTDWVQAGRYAAGLDPLTLAGGPSAGPGFAYRDPDAASEDEAQSPGVREVRVSSATAVHGLTVTVPVILESLGDENALGFSVTFDPTVFQYYSASKGSAAGSATLNVNPNQAGKVGMTLALPTGSMFAAGSREVARVTFTAIAPVSSNAPIGLGDQPVLRAISDVGAGELSAIYTAGSVFVNPKPSLSVAQTNGNAVLSWPTWADGFNLQSKDSLSSGSWSNVIGTLQTNGGVLSITLPVSGESKYFRLHHP